MKLEDSSSKPAHLEMDPIWKGFGVAMSSSPWEWLWNGDEDVATPLHAGAVLWEEFEAVAGLKLKTWNSSLGRVPTPGDGHRFAAWGHAAFKEGEACQPFSEAMSMQKRYFTSDRTRRS